MSKAGKQTIEGLEEAVAFAKGEKTGAVLHTIHVPDKIDVQSVRTSTGLSQSQFAKHYGFGLTTLQAWEQGRRNPGLTARILLRVVQKEPAAVQRALASSAPRSPRS